MEFVELLKNEYKIYVDVIVEHHSDGRIIPISFTWEDGTTYKIKKILDKRPAASLKAGGTGMRYFIQVGNTQTYLWLEEDKDLFRWFMEKK